MIFLLGGTAETEQLATRLAAAGFDVLVSTATEVPLKTGLHTRIRRRTGPLDAEDMAEVLRENGCSALVDAAHPYAEEAHHTAAKAAQAVDIGYYRFVRPPGVPSAANVERATTHYEAARMAFSYGVPVLLTIGTRHLAPYIEQSRARNVPLVARVLPVDASLSTCHALGLDDACIIAERGPFSVETNRNTIQQYGIGVIVTKDGGAPGGTPEKLEAANVEGCKIVLVERPVTTGTVFEDVDALLSALTI